MKVAGTTSILTILIVVAIIHEGSPRSNEQFHDASFLDQLDKDILDEDKHIEPVAPHDIFKMRSDTTSNNKNDGVKTTAPCFQPRRQAVLVPTVERYSKRAKMDQQVECNDPSFTNIKINAKGCYIEIFYNIPARRTVMQVQHRTVIGCCPGYKGKSCNEKDLNAEIDKDIDSLRYNDDEAMEYSMKYNENGDTKGYSWMPIDGALKQVSVADGMIVGVDSADKIYFRTEVDASNPYGKEWKQLSGELTFVSVGDGKIMGVNKDDEIYFRTGISAKDPEGTGWKQIDGLLTQIWLGDGKIMGVNRNDDIYYRTGVSTADPDGTGWKQLSGKLKFISVGDGKILGVNRNDDIYYRTGVSTADPEGVSWEQSPGDLKLKQIYVGNGKIMGVSSANQIYFRFGIDSQNPYGTKWKSIEGGLTFITAGKDKIMGTNEDGEIFYLDGVKPAVCKRKCHNDGKCIGPDKCECRAGFTGPTCKEATTKCERVTDIGFILDSSGSLRHYYHDEKNFLKALAKEFGVTAEGTHAGVVTFSSRVELSIRLGQYNDQTSFDHAVDRIPLMGKSTRIDLALQYAWSVMFSPNNGARSDVPKLMVLLTDGSQSKARDSQVPAVIAEKIRKYGIHLLVIGIGSGIKKRELAKIAGGPDKWYRAKNWDILKSKKFVDKMSKSICKAAKAICVKTCLNEGHCVDGQCSCPLYWKGDQCQTPICATPCQNGDCVKPNTCSCRDGWKGSLCEEAICKRECKNGGRCVSPDRCKCAQGYEGADCGFPFCSKGCGEGGSCIAPETCMCGAGRTGPTCETVTPTETPGGGGGLVPVDESATCTVSGHALFKSFDGNFFMFPGLCTYQLAGDCVDQSFAVHVSIDPTCTPLYNKPCKRTVHLFFLSDINVKLDNSGISVNGESKPLPYSYKNLVIKNVGDFVMVEGWNGLKMRWDGHDGVYLTMSKAHQNKTCGLCGNYDGIKDNDFTTYQGKLTTNVAVFGNSWARTKIDEKCPNVFKKDLESKYDKLSYHESRQVGAICDPLLNSDSFQECRNLVNVMPYFHECREEVARCEPSTRKQCVCNTFTQYSRACAGRDVILNWRTSSLCPAICNNGNVHTECGTSCPKTCHNLIHHASCQHSCVDGCFCPSGLVSNGTHCVNEYHCTCTHEKKVYKNGDAINKDCNKCYCTRGRWKCTERKCPGTCTVFGYPHFKTFDGKWFNFDGICKYILSQDVNQLYTIIIENVPCSSLSTYMIDSCGKSLRVRLNGTEIRLQQDFKVVVDHTPVSLPYVGPGVEIKQASSCFVRLQASIGLDILFDKRGSKILVTVDASFANKTIGLCGTFDKIQENDFTTSDGNIDTNAATFGKSWNLDPRCREVDPSTRDPCELQPQRAPVAEKKCNKLVMEPFTKCHNVINPRKYIELCTHDVCSCIGGKDCLCNAIATYAHECALKGVVINWRNEDILPECAIKCPANQEFQECGSLCKRTCRDMATYKSCEEQCIPGCNCPDGTLMNDLGSCVLLSECTCHIDGNTHSPEDVVYKDRCTKCVCINGQFNCTTTTECGKTCPGNQVWTDKKVSCFKTCDNLHLPCLQSINPVGCHCPDDTVWDDNLQKCVEDRECPCHHNGKSYYNGQSYKFECNNCTCKDSKWRCTTNSCSGTCRVYGDPHYRTFDGKKFHFEGRCSYILSEDHCGKPGSFRIQAENVACGTTGATCSKSVMITLQDTMITLIRGEAIKYAPAKTGEIMKARFKVIKTTFFDIIHAEIGVTIMWDRGTRLLVSLQPKFIGKTCGLCGNFNGNQEDDFTTPEGDIGITPEVFGDSYKIEDSCPDTKPPVHPCVKAKYRAAWSHKQCSIIHGDLFAPCHIVVNPKPYYDACYYDTCGCDMGGDCECLCTAVAAYAQVCNAHGVHVKWRSQEFCPIQCDTCEEYKACGTSHPETCENRCEPRETLPVKCVEGCFCPNGTVKDQNGKCVKVEECPCYVEGIAYPPNSIVMSESNGCHKKCVCHSGCLVDCMETCVPTPKPTTPVVTKPTTEATTPVVTKPTTEATTAVVTTRTTEATTPVVTKRTTEATTPVVTKPTTETTTPVVTKPTTEATTPVVTTPTTEATTPVVTKPTTESTTPVLTKPTTEATTPEITVKSTTAGTTHETTVRSTTVETTTEPPTTPSCTGPKKHKCVNETTCIDSRKVCDKHCDCLTCTDEINCPTTCPPCSKLNFKCHTSCQCIPRKFVCDSQCDCNDCTDETGCTTTSPITTRRPVTTPPSLCPHNKIMKVCVKGCEQDCDFLRKSKNCAKNDTCHVACGCPEGLFNNGTHCVPATSCECFDVTAKKFHQPGESWDSGCSTCTCFNNSITCSPKPCPTVYCPAPGKLVTQPGSCCPTCACPTCPIPTPRPCWPTEIKCTLKGKPKCIPPSWICDGEIDCDHDEDNCTTPMPPCTDKLGLSDRIQIPDGHFSASSFGGISFRPSNARLNPVHHIDHNGGAWCAEAGRPGPHWIEVDLGSPMQITKVATKGQMMTSRYAVTYRLLYSLNGYAWDIFKEHGKDKLFPSNSNWDDLVVNKLSHRIVARYVRIYVERYVRRACLRMELFGCGARPITTASPTPATTPATTPCPEFLCEDHKKCIPFKWVCNKRKDCKDGSDENPKICEATCSPTQFKCKEGKCIPKSYVCDGDPDCRLEEDEKDCPTTTPFTTRTTPITLGTSPATSTGPTAPPTTTAPTAPITIPTAPSTTIPTSTAGTTVTKTTTRGPVVTTAAFSKATTLSTKQPTTFEVPTSKPETTPSTLPEETTTIPTTTTEATTPIKTTRTTEETPKIHTYSESTTKGSQVMTTQPTQPTEKSTTAGPTTECPPKSTCICENTCDSLADNRTGCTQLECIDECRCPTGYVRNNVTGYCDPDIHCACVLHDRIYKVGAVVKTGDCKQCICKPNGFACGVKYCHIKTCPPGKVLTHYEDSDKCCECTEPLCPEGKTRVECGCAETCPALEDKHTLCDLDHCVKDTCVCADGKVDNGTACVETSDCHCSVNGIIHPAGSRWHQGDCQECKCVDGEVTCGKVCSKQECPEGYKLVDPDSDDKCCYCELLPTTRAPTKETTISVTTKVTTPETTPVTTPGTTPATTAAPKGTCKTIKKTEHFVDSHGCKTNYPIEQSECNGQCPSTTDYDHEKGKAISDCKCCKPFQYRKNLVPMTCPDGTTKDHIYYIFLSCQCYNCGANPFGRDLPMESSDEYAL